MNRHKQTSFTQDITQNQITGLMSEEQKSQCTSASAGTA